MDFPKSFTDLMVDQLGLEKWLLLAQSLSNESPTSIRVNPLKNDMANFVPDIPWCSLGKYLPQRPKFTLDPLFHAGSYYVQEASSMFIWHILETLSLDKTNIKILDLCAAPGGKSTLIASYLKGQGLLVSNEVIKSRAYTLKYNLSKEGHSNVVVTNNDVKDFSQCGAYFDLILVDAPCSGEGMFRKDAKAITEWSLDNVEMCSIRQKKIIEDVLPALKKDGFLIYSTCTYNNKENIDNILWSVNSLPVISTTIDIENSWNIEPIKKENAVGYQFFPNQIKGEGFFVSVLQKTSADHQKSKDKKMHYGDMMALNTKSKSILNTWINPEGQHLIQDKAMTVHAIPEDLLADTLYLHQNLRLLNCGVSLGSFTKDLFIPNHSLALSTIKHHEIASVDLNLEESLLYLKKELHEVSTNHKSWILMKYGGLGIGWAKNLGNRINNYLPQEYRILMDLR